MSGCEPRATLLPNLRASIAFGPLIFPHGTVKVGRDACF